MRPVLEVTFNILNYFDSGRFVLEQFDGFFVAVFLIFLFRRFNIYTCAGSTRRALRLQGYALSYFCLNLCVAPQFAGLGIERVLRLLFLESRVKRARRRGIHC